jgi:hypothetical protein
VRYCIEQFKITLKSLKEKKIEEVLFREPWYMLHEFGIKFTR